MERSTILKEGENEILLANGVGNSIEASQSEKDTNTTFHNSKRNLKVTTRTIISPKDPKHSDTFMQELNDLESKENAWLMQGNVHSSNNDMCMLPRTNNFVGVSSPAMSTVSEITTNTGSYKNGTCNVGAISAC